MVMEKKIRVFSGIKPSADLMHIGNYLGAIRNWVEYQKPEFENVFCVVDLHAITVPQDPVQLKKNTIEITKVYLACGIDPQKSILFVQSERPEHSELGWILGCFTSFGELSRMIQFKEKSGETKGSVSAGLFNYPTLMAADILLYGTNIVPVGDDQKQHVELARDIAIRMNNKFGKMFTVPEPDIKPVGARIMGLDDPAKKMSKSAGSEYNYIALRDAPDVIKKKIQRAVTDSGSEIVFDKEKKPALANLLTIYSLFADEKIEDIVSRYKGKGYAEFKKELAEVIICGLAPIQDRLRELDEDPKYVAEVLSAGAEKAAPIAAATLVRVKGKIGLG
jgi:tryptophanyl-tRNA synthetase